MKPHLIRFVASHGHEPRDFEEEKSEEEKSEEEKSMDTVHERRRRLNAILDLLAITGPQGAAYLVGREVYASGATRFSDLAELLDLGCATLKDGVYTWASRLPDPYLLPESRARQEAMLAADRARVQGCAHEWGGSGEAGKNRTLRACKKCGLAQYSDSSD